MAGIQNGLALTLPHSVDPVQRSDLVLPDAASSARPSEHKIMSAPKHQILWIFASIIARQPEKRKRNRIVKLPKEPVIYRISVTNLLRCYFEGNT
jgi:hypothetical protein